ncbi:hypothetical protein LINPERHAP2_LOCUS31891 [Linum perenne]
MSGAVGCHTPTLEIY